MPADLKTDALAIVIADEGAVAALMRRPKIKTLANLWVTGRVPWYAAAVILARDLLLVAGYKLVVPRGYEFEVNRLGKIATWGLYASIALLIVTDVGVDWPLRLFWIALALALVAAVQYVLKARREVRR